MPSSDSPDPETRAVEVLGYRVDRPPRVGTELSQHRPQLPPADLRVSPAPVIQSMPLLSPDR